MSIQPDKTRQTAVKKQSKLLLPVWVAALAAGMCLIERPVATSATLKRAIKGSVNLVNVTSVTGTFGPVDMTKSLLIATGAVNTNRPSRTHFTAQLTSGSTAVFTRNATNATTYPIYYTVLEWSNGVSVQRGGGVTTGTASIRRTISSVGTLANAFALVTYRTTGGDNDIDSDDYPRFNLMSTTSLGFDTAAASSSNGNYEYQVVTYDRANVQRGSVSIGTAATTGTVSVTPPNSNKTWLIYSCSTTQATADSRDRTILGRLTSGGTLLFSKANTGGTSSCEYQAVEFTDGTLVQSGTVAYITTATTGIALLNPEFSTGTTVAVGGWLWSCGSSTLSGNDTFGMHCGNYHMTTRGSLVINRPSTGNTAVLPWSVISFPKRKVNLAE